VTDRERDSLAGRVSRYARVGAGVGGAAARIAGARLFGRDLTDARNAADLAATLGDLKGPLMKIAQLLGTIPDLVPPEFAAEMQKLQAEAPPMGAAFVRRRMKAELGADWRDRFADFDMTPAAAASLGQVHRARLHDGRDVAVKLQYPAMASAVEADLSQLGVLLSVQRRFSPELDTSEVGEELAERLREELDYAREARNIALYRDMLAGEASIRVPEAVPELSSPRLLTMTWLDGSRLLDHVERPLAERNRIAAAMFRAWWMPFFRYGVIHADPHLGNYTVFEEEGRPHGLNLLDFGAVRVFPPGFVGGVIELYEGFRNDDRERIAGAYRKWGFRDVTDDLIDTLNIWARFIYSPLLDDRVRSMADGVSPQDYGRREVYQVQQRLKALGTVTIPREFVFMDRAAIGLGAVMLHLKAEMNFHRLFADLIAGFDERELADRQQTALAAAGLHPAAGAAG